MNAVAEINTYLEPEELIDELMEIEADLIRKREIKWGPRTIDLDIIFYDDLIINSEKLIIPHPRIQEREFVLKPLNEIAPYLIHPVLNKSISILLKELNDSAEK
jgi:dihydroneopterin aldolase/2-amino-4-hydroxy-6-hydroxymethyldihydropteridine diphosphokinase